MSQNNDYIAAIDIGTTKIVAIVGQKEQNSKINILGIGQTESKGVKRGVVLNIEETSNAIQEAVEQAQITSGKTFKEVYVGIAGQHIKSVKNRHSKYIQGHENEITQDDIDELIEDMHKIALEAGEEIIHVIPQNYIVDNETGVKNPVGMSGKKLEANFHIVIGQVASARNIKKCITRAGMEVRKLILEPLASSDAILTEDEKEAGVALVDIGGGSTDMAVYYDGIIRHTAVIPFGGNVVTKDIKEGFSILQRHAEKLKVEYGQSLADLASENKVVTIPGISGREPKEISFKSLAHIIQARMEEIIEAVEFEIENSGYRNKLGAGIALTGGGALLKHLSQLINYKTGLDVRIGYPNVLFNNKINTKAKHPMYSTSVGLILKGYDLQKKHKNDEPYDIINEEIEGKTKNKDSLISVLRDTISNIFEDKDSKM